jgi:hypothetical protein
MLGSFRDPDKPEHNAGVVTTTSSFLGLLWRAEQEPHYGQNACITFTLACAPGHGHRHDPARRGAL